MSASASFNRLHRGVQRWIYSKGWPSLRGIQEIAVEPILKAQEDILITAPTAGGKTEAAFLPVVSAIADSEEFGYGAICISPLKALINDQFQRLESLCEYAGTEVTPWHGDISTSVKSKSWKSPDGILLITPESLEAMFVRRSGALKSKMSCLQYVIIDEFHAFIDRDRGQQLLSLLSRLDDLLGRSVPRIALSATIGDPLMALQLLRPGGGRAALHLEDPNAGGADLKLSLTGYIPNPAAGVGVAQLLAYDLFSWLRGTSNLVFANSRRVVEEVTDELSSICERNALPLEFFAHHGSLSKDVRHFVENRLREGIVPTTAIATSTLELGIDIGDVNSVAQVGAPANVSSMRQRLGRSGRRGTPSTMRILIASSAAKDDPSPLDLMEAETFQAVAAINLMLEGWIEPPSSASMHVSTLVQQILSMIAFKGDVSAQKAYSVLCRTGPWINVTPDFFMRVLRGLGNSNVIQQLPTGELIIGEAGEPIVNSHHFYTAFEAPEEFRLYHEGKQIGSIPLDSPLMTGQLIIFGGRRWQVVSIDLRGKAIMLRPGTKGEAPIFGGESAPVNRVIRQRMRDLYESSVEPTYCSVAARNIMGSARDYYRSNALSVSPFVHMASSTFWFVWDDDRVVFTLLVALVIREIPCSKVGPALVIEDPIDGHDLVELTAAMISSSDFPKVLQEKLPPIALGKYDLYAGDEVLYEAFISEKLSLSGALEYLSTFN